jgi:tRNA pseudouridine32 synthase/23S rRNA pseudouridine746 synthase
MFPDLSDHILFLDGEAMVLDKPAGLPVDRPRDRSPSLEDRLGELTFGFRRLPQPVHRLDRDTSGCLLLARNPKAHRRFGESFAQGAVTKSYLAVLDGEPRGEEGMIDLPLVKISTAESGWRMHGDPAGKPARTRWRLLGISGGRAYVVFHPETGRTHQLRVHAAEGLGVPILGDPVYGKTGPHLLLHAASLRVPRAGKPDIAATAPLPPHFPPDFPV